MQTTATKARPLFDPPIVRRAIADSFRKLDPRVQLRNPVMFVVLVASVFTTVLFVQALGGAGEAPAWFIFSVSAWLWFTSSSGLRQREGDGREEGDPLVVALREDEPRDALGLGEPGVQGSRHEPCRSRSGVDEARTLASD